MRVLSKMVLLVLAAALIALAASCATTGPGGQKSLILISTEQEMSIGKSMDEQLRQQERFLVDESWHTYINELGNRIVAVSDRKELPFQFAVIQSDEINAFAAPGGYVYFYSGLIREMDSEAELAAVMAHEISHVVARHSIKRLQTVMGVSVVLDLALGTSSQTTQALAGTALGIMMSGYSRGQETEADNFGTLYMTQAGWNPNGMVAMFQKLEVLSGQGEHEMGLFEMLASSHPATTDRIAATTEEITGMMPLPSTLKMDTPRFQEMKKRLPAKTK